MELLSLLLKEFKMVLMAITHNKNLKIIIMEKLKELEFSEMVNISGGVNVAYEVGYAIGKVLKREFFIVTLCRNIFSNFNKREMQII